MSRLFDSVVRNSHYLWHAHLDVTGKPFCFSQSAELPSREQRITDYMSIPIYTPTRDHRGWSIWGEPRYASREEAERAVGPSSEAAA